MPLGYLEPLELGPTVQWCDERDLIELALMVQFEFTIREVYAM